jgi:nitrous oxidase accessory protein
MKTHVLLFIIISFLLILFSSGCITDENKTVPKEKRTIYVNNDGTQEFTKIQDAINASNNGDTVIVYNGTYYGPITIDKSISLFGENENNTQIILDYNHAKILDNKYSYYPGHEFVIVHIIADNCIVQGFTIQNYVKTMNVSDQVEGIQISSSNNIVSNTSIRHCKYGVFIFSKSRSNIENNTISFNNISSNTEGGIYNWYNSKNNSFYNNEIFNNFYGIIVKGASYNNIYSNSITHNLNGISLCCGATNNTIHLNTFTNNSGMSAHDSSGGNAWDDGHRGNYWDDYLKKYPNATQADGLWNIPYDIPGGSVKDQFPLVNPMKKN